MALQLAGCETVSPRVPIAEARTLSIPASSAPSACVPLARAATVLAAAPDGTLWVWLEGELLQIEASGAWTPRLALAAPPSQLTPRPDGRVTVLAEGALSTLDGLSALEGDARADVRLPVELGAPTAFCGDVGGDGIALVRSETGWFRRLGEDYVRMVDPVFDDATLAPEATGACVSGGDSTWLPARDGAHRLDLADGTLTRDPLSRSTGFSARATSYAYVDGALVWLRGSQVLQPLAFDAMPLRTALTDDALWVELAGAVVRVAIDEGRLAEPVDMASFASGGDGFWADASGGAWLRRGDEACRIEPSGPRIVGLESDARVAATRTVRIEGAPGARHVVRVDDIEVARGELPLEVTLTTTHPGWHSMTAHLESEDGQPSGARITRPFEVTRETGVRFEADLLPLLEMHCGDCHGGSGPAVPLLTRDELATRAERARERVAAGEMPPRPRDPAPADLASLIGLWVEGGRLP